MIEPDALPAEVIEAAVENAGMDPLAAGVAEKFSRYFDLLRQWNARLNLTAIRDPEGVLRRHFLECIFCAENLPDGIATLLDYGSGAGFPGLPIALCRPEILVTLAESQGKKASFLREAVRSLGVAAEVRSGRVEELPSDLRFDAVSLRAVERMAEAVERGAQRLRDSGWLVVLATKGFPGIPAGFRVTERTIPGSENGVLMLAQKENVPRETLR